MTASFSRGVVFCSCSRLSLFSGSGVVVLQQTCADYCETMHASCMLTPFKPICIKRMLDIVCVCISKLKIIDNHPLNLSPTSYAPSMPALLSDLTSLTTPTTHHLSLLSYRYPTLHPYTTAAQPLPRHRHRHHTQLVKNTKGWKIYIFAVLS